jgi:hypothetical protein
MASSERCGRGSGTTQHLSPSRLSRQVRASVADPDPPDPHVFGPPCMNPLVRGMNPAPDPSITKQK